jgi:hypothetical protein
VKIRDVEKGCNAGIASSVSKFTNLRAIGFGDVRMAVVMFAGDKQQVSPIRGPLGSEIERLTGRNLACVRPVRKSDVDLIALVVGDLAAVRRCAEAVGKLL